MSNTKHTEVTSSAFYSAKREIIRLKQQNQSLLEALKEVAGLWEEELPLDLTTYNKVKNAIKQAEQ